MQLNLAQKNERLWIQVLGKSCAPADVEIVLSQLKLECLVSFLAGGLISVSYDISLAVL